MIRSVGAAALFADLRRWMWSDDLAVGMMRDLTIQHTPPRARVEIEIVPLDQSLADGIFDPRGLDPVALGYVERRRALWESGIPGAYVAVDEDGDPCYVQWVIDGADTDLVRAHFGPIFPALDPDELLLEGAWATPRARGRRIMGEAMSRITEAGARPHHRCAITFVGVDNEPSIRGCRSAGFEVYICRTETWRLGRRRIFWNEPVPS